MLPSEKIREEVIMAAKSTLRNMLLCLTGVCLVCSAILGSVYVLTEKPIEQANLNILNRSISEVLPEGGVLSEKLEYDSFEYYTLSEDGVIKAYAVKTSEIGFGGPLSLMVGVLPDGTVYKTSVLSHSETPGLGAKCKTDHKFISQFNGFGQEKKLSVKKDGGDLDAITGSTITSRAYSSAVSQAVELVKRLGEK
ncbi:MAG: RnfABCDGE type electron transport complex subunit G [Candidatus Cryptobacteroides sp.]